MQISSELHLHSFIQSKTDVLPVFLNSPSSLHKQTLYISSQQFGIIRILQMFLCSPRLHLYVKNYSNIVN